MSSQDANKKDRGNKLHTPATDANISFDDEDLDGWGDELDDDDELDDEVPQTDSLDNQVNAEAQLAEDSIEAISTPIEEAEEVSGFVVPQTATAQEVSPIADELDLSAEKDIPDLPEKPPTLKLKKQAYEQQEEQLEEQLEEQREEQEEQKAPIEDIPSPSPENFSKPQGPSLSSPHIATTSRALGKKGTGLVPASTTLGAYGTDSNYVATPKGSALENLAKEVPSDKTNENPIKKTLSQASARPLPAGPLRRHPSTFHPDMKAPLAVLPDEVIPESELPKGDKTWLTSFDIFKQETQQLAREGNWKKIAAITAYALNHAKYATQMTRTSMFLDLAQLYRDRLRDNARAEQTFAVLAKEEPASAEALEYLTKVYQEQERWVETFDLYIAAVEATWDPNERVRWTKQAATLATNHIGDIDYAIKAWEHLWQLGDGVEEAAKSLTRYYRKAERWDEMATFLRQQVERAQGTHQLLLLRELTEVLLTGLQSPDEASKVLEQIVALSPQDSIATLQLARVYAQRKEWEALERLGQKSADEEKGIDLQHLVADSLWLAERKEQAVAAYDRILENDPKSIDALARKEIYLTETEQFEELLTLLKDRVSREENIKEKTRIFAQAATLAAKELNRADDAITLWEEHTKLMPDVVDGYVALTDLYEEVNNLNGIANALEGQLRLARDTKQKVELLKRLGEHYSRRLSDDERAENCWKRILSLTPSDLPTRKELTALHRRRQDFEGLNSSLLRQIWLSDDSQWAEDLCRQAAVNLDDHFEDPLRSISAWRRVLDFRPLDDQALEQLSQHYATLDEKRELIAVKEQQIRASTSHEEKIGLAIDIADLWEQDGSVRAAAAAYERVLRWEPTHKNALKALIRIYSTNQEAGKATGIIDNASALVQRLEQIELAREHLALVPEDDHKARFFQLRRILFLSSGDGNVVDELHQLAEKAGLWVEMASVLIQLACQQQAEDDRIDVLTDLATLYEKHLKRSDLAFLVQQSIMLSPEHHKQISEDVERLAHDTNRHEDLLTILDRMTTTEFPLGDRKKTIVARAQICEKNIDDAHRAFNEYRRQLELDPDDWNPLTELTRLAKDHQLHIELDAVFAELWDRTDDLSKRMDLLKERELISRKDLKEPLRAFDFLIRRFRLDENDLDLLQNITTAAEELKLWQWLLPIIEAAQRASTENHSVEELMVTAALYEEKLSDMQRAFSIYRDIFVQSPRSGKLLEKLFMLAKKTKSFDELANALRLAAASTESSELALTLLRHVIEIYEKNLKRPDDAIDIHRRILDLKQDEIPSLEVTIDWHRTRNEYRDLRDRLQQWCQLAPEEMDRIPHLLEIAALSERYLEEPEEALSAYGLILDIKPDHKKANKGLDGLITSIKEPSLRKRWLHMQKKGADEARVIELQLEIAKISEHELEDVDAAVSELRDLLDTHGANGPGFSPLRKLLTQEERFDQLVELLQSRSEALKDPIEKLAALDEALLISHDKLGEDYPELRERLYRAVLALRPQDHNVSIRLRRLLRNSGRFHEFTEHLSDHIIHVANRDQKIAIYHELGRIEALNLKEVDSAKRSFERINDLANDEAALLALAHFAAQNEAWNDYIDLRERQALLLEPQEAAIVFCHLAEICDEKGLNKKMVEFYRQARNLDTENTPAMEALKGIGRRLKTLRPAAALLPLEGEKELTLDERASKLKELGDGAFSSDIRSAIDWYLRAVATAPQNIVYWQALHDAYCEASEFEKAYRAKRNWFYALWLSKPFDPDQIKSEAQAIFDLSISAKAASKNDIHDQLVTQSFELMPNFAPAALARAEALLELEKVEEADALLQEVLEHYHQDLNDNQLSAALYARGVTRRTLDKTDRALQDFRRTLEINPLHADCLISMGELQAEMGRTAAALELQIRALMVVENPSIRARLYYQIGILWEDQIKRQDEAGACYEMSLLDDLDERDLLHRALRHFQRSGRLDESLDVVSGLLPTAVDPDELASLWLVRGEILATRENSDEQAIEAFDMALSYQPTSVEAREGLVKVLERKGDWTQLLQVLEASADSDDPKQRAKALLHMAQLTAEKLQDLERSEDYIRQSIDIYPLRDAYVALEKRCTESGVERQEEREIILGEIVKHGPPFLDPYIQLGELLLEKDKNRAWCLLSPALGVSQVDTKLKSTVQSMRKKHERPPVLFTSEENRSLLKSSDLNPVLEEVLTELLSFEPDFGYPSVDEISEESAIIVNPTTSLGKTFSAFAEAMNLPNVQLYRSQNLNEALVVIHSVQNPSIIIRTDVMQQLVHAEVGFIFAYALELIRPEHRSITALPAPFRTNLIPALMHAVDLASELNPADAALADQIRSVTDQKDRDRWQEKLEPLTNEDLTTTAQKHLAGIYGTAERAGILAGADTRQVFRVLARMHEDIPRPRVVARLSELDEYIEGSEILKRVISFAASAEFGKLLELSDAISA